MRFNGKSNQQNYLNYDGVDGTYVWDASPGYLNSTGSQFRLQTSMESVAEFRVNSGLAPAESGLGAGGSATIAPLDLARPAGFAFSDTAFRIFILMASRRLNSDRFFTRDYTPQVYTQAGLDWIDDNTMATVLLRHHPELGPAMRSITNAFVPWEKAGQP